MTFKPVTLQSDVDSQVLGLARQLYSKVPLPSYVNNLGGIDWLLTITAMILEKMTLAEKLDVILWGNDCLTALCDRLAHIWLESSNSEDKKILEDALIKHKLYYKT